jgi:putative transposase
MKKRFSVEQIVAVLKQAELGLPVADLIRKVGISEQTFYRWKKQYAGLETDQVREFKQLTDENTRLKKLVTELSLDKAVLQDVLSKTYGPPRPQAVLRPGLISLRQRIRSRSDAPAKMEIRASWSS